MKYFISEKLYLINGTEIQFDVNDKTGTPQRELMRVSFSMGYRVDSDLLIELGYKPRIGSPNLSVSESILSIRESTFFLKA
ncbi:hypothetical protein [Ascidiimonas aurantiaca]|uniref:hypothetical protein n=1 Tax=Ascidiimonas aurantiaca TaxID=1685432 RepID=UPI0030EC424A